VTGQTPVRVIPGGLHRDARGVVQHVNGFGFDRVDRFYTISPAAAGEVRGWVGHLREWKCFFAVRGEFTLGVVQPRDWVAPSPDDRVELIPLRGNEPCVVEVPPGHYTAACAAGPDSTLLVFSSGQIAGATTDDYRLTPDFWPLSLPS
jgi:hypothetical protein